MRPMNRIKRRMIAFWLIVLVMAGTGVARLERGLTPVVLLLGEAQVRSMGIQAVNDAVKSVLGQELLYSDLVHLVQDGDGKVAMIQANTVRMNMLANQMAVQIQNSLTDMGIRGISVPIGTVIGGKLLAGRGPEIHLKIQPVGSVAVEFVTAFEEAGINQTRHTIFLKAATTLQIVAPTGNRSVEVEHQIAIAESIIVGEVPESYFQFGTGDVPAE